MLRLCWSGFIICQVGGLIPPINELAGIEYVHIDVSDSFMIRIDIYVLKGESAPAQLVVSDLDL